MSTDFQGRIAKSWQDRVAPLEDISSALLFLIAPMQYAISMEAMRRVRAVNFVANGKPVSIELGENQALHGKEWRMPFTGVQIIANRVTLPHRDGQGNFATGDLLTSLGTHKGARFIVDDLGGSFSYDPGTFEFICGRLLEHSCGPWREGDRICYARYTHDTVHQCARVPAPPWLSIQNSLHGVSNGFGARYLKAYGLALDFPSNVEE